VNDLKMRGKVSAFSLNIQRKSPSLFSLRLMMRGALRPLGDDVPIAS
jgi:hypothetical protein